MCHFELIANIYVNIFFYKKQPTSYPVHSERARPPKKSVGMWTQTCLRRRMHQRKTIRNKGGQREDNVDQKPRRNNGARLTGAHLNGSMDVAGAVI